MTEAPLNGLIILIVEDEYFLADELERKLTGAGATVGGPVGSVSDALAVIDATGQLDYALLDVNLNGETAIPVADHLTALAVPFAFVTGYGSGGIPSRYEGVRRFVKPVETGDLIKAIVANRILPL